MTDEKHCPGFESNKSLKPVKVKCPDCGKEWEVFSDEVEKHAKCPACGAVVDPKTCIAS
jgi:ribosomal protein S27E